MLSHLAAGVEEEVLDVVQVSLDNQLDVFLALIDGRGSLQFFHLSFK